jgi:hypothetical protein
MDTDKKTASPLANFGEKRFTWPKGVSGNPSGRRKINPEEREAREAAEEVLIGGAVEAARVLLDCMRGKRMTSLREKAASNILDRTLGLPTKRIDIWTRIQSITSIEDLDREIARVMALETTRKLAAPVIEAEAIEVSDDGS